MPIESEQSYLPPEQKFERDITTRFDLWTSIVDDSGVSDDLKREIKEALTNLKDKGLKSWKSLEDAFYGTVNKILTLTEAWRKKDDEATTVFETLRDDIWDFYKEISN